MVDYAYVNIWGQTAGVVRWVEEEHLADFQYDRNFLSYNWDLAPIKMPIKNGDRIYRFPELIPEKNTTHDTFKGLPGLIADSLPDRYGNLLIEKWLAANGRPPNSMNPVEKLCFIGSRGIGALEYKPALMKQNKNTFAIEIKSLVNIAQKILSQRQHFNTDLNSQEHQAMKEILKIGTSAGGARPKAVIAYNPKTKEVRSGQTNTPKGFEHWLLKLDGVSGVQFGDSHGWGRVEYAYYLMAKACGIIMTDCQLLEENNRAHFMTRRFDRQSNNIKHHVQTLCGIQHFDFNDMYSFSYEQVFQTMRELRLSYPEAEQMFRRMVFNVLARNCDDHTKNISFLLKQGQKWELAPAYDICYAYSPDNFWVNKQTLSINNKQENISNDDFMTIAKANTIKKGETIINDIAAIINAWPNFAHQAGVNHDLKIMIHNNIKNR